MPFSGDLQINITRIAKLAFPPQKRRMDLQLSSISTAAQSKRDGLSTEETVEYYMERMREAEWTIGEVEMRSDPSVAFRKNQSYERLLDVESVVFNCFLFIAKQHESANRTAQFQFLVQVYLGVSRHLQSCLVECLSPVIRQVRRVAQLLNVSISKNQVGIVAYDGLLGSFCMHSVSEIEEIVARAEDKWTKCQQIYLTTEQLQQMMQLVLDDVLKELEKFERLEDTIEHAKNDTLKATEQAEKYFKKTLKRKKCTLKASICGVLGSAGLGTVAVILAKTAYALIVHYVTKK